MIEPYWTDGTVTLYHGDYADVLSQLELTADLIVTDPPYGETALPWDRWPQGWPAALRNVAGSMWCFGSMRMFLGRVAEFTTAGWRLSQDIVWQKPVGTNASADRFRRVHEHALHWYRGPWAAIHHDVPRCPADPAAVARNRGNAPRGGRDRGGHLGTYVRDPGRAEDGTRLMPSVVPASTVRGRTIHPTEKPVGLLTPLILYGCPPGGLILDPFAGSGSTLEAARLTGRRAIGIEINEQYCELAARQLAQALIPEGA